VEEPLESPRSLKDRLAASLAEWAPTVRGFDVRVTTIMIVAAIALVVFKKYGNSGFYESTLVPDALRGHARQTVMGDFYWFLSCFVMLGVVPVLAVLRFATPSELGMGIGDARFGLKWVAILYAVMFPVIAIASRSESFANYYPLNDQIGAHAVDYFSGRNVRDDFLVWFLAYEALYVIYFIGWELFFRGFMTFGLFDRLGFNGVLAANIPFVLLHAGKPLPEAIGSVIAGIALGLFALRARSFWYCWLLHALIAVSMDLLAIQRRVELIGGPGS
jgi:hypothetical protein